MKKLFYLGTILALLLQPAIASPSSASTPDASGSVLAVEGTIHYVDADASGDNDGSTWEDAFTILQPALDAATSGDQIWVAAGTYVPTDVHCGSGDRFRSFQLTLGVALYGGFNPTSGDIAWENRDFVNNPTILSGDIGTPEDATDNSYHVFCHPDGWNLDTSAILDGFTITDGNANGAAPHNQGGGMYNYYSSPTLTDVTFSGNTASSGGGMYNNYSTLILANVIFSSNTADDYGGGMYNATSSPTLTNVIFSSNTASSGGGMYNFYFSSPTLTNITFSGNTASQYGGGMYNFYKCSPTLTNITFSGNTASQYGGGMHNLYSSSPTLANVTISGNSASSGGGMYNYDNSSPTLTNSILWGNSQDQIFNVDSSPVVTYSDVQGSYTGTGNINLDPKFIRTPSPGLDGVWGTPDDDYGDLRLQPTSSAIDAGNNAAVPAGITTDLSGAPRFVDIPTIQDIGAGDPPIVDMGAYEVQNTLLLLPLILK